MTSISQMGYEAVDNAPPLATGRSGKTGYNETVIKYFTIASIFWGVAGMTVGLLLAAQLAWPMLNFEPWLNFGRLRPLHTSAVIFAFGGNMVGQVLRRRVALADNVLTLTTLSAQGREEVKSNHVLKWTRAS